MAWMNVLQLEERYIDPEFRKAFVELFTLRTFLSRCLVQSEYKPPDTLGEAISLTPIGKEWVSRTQAAIKDISEQEINLAFFLKFFHHDLFIDVNHTNTETIRQVLDADIIGGKIKYRWVYNRTLYDRFFEMFSVSTRELPYEETMKLLDNTPQGVFQLRDFVVGSFGVLYSSCIRFLLPTRSAALWHCSDPSCEGLHSVRLSTGNNKVEEAIAFISNESEKIYGSPSDWENFFRHTGFPEALDYHDDMYPQLFPWLIANAFSETEIRNILRMLIDQHSKQLRERFPKTYRFKDMLLGSAEKISKGLTKAQCFQLILLMPNESIANCIELLIDEQVIKIPSTETRNPQFGPPSESLFDINWECTRFGMRAVSQKLDISFARLRRLIKELYKEEKELAQLQWQLRHLMGQSIYEKLDKYVHTEDPRRIVSDLILNSPDHIQRAFKILRYGYFVLPSSSEGKEHLIDKILWKLGFDIGLYPTHQRFFWDRLEKFVQNVRTYNIYTENDKELIRSAGVNFFVSLEEILDYSLSFSTWALLSDHYGATKFKCNFDEARRFMASRLNGLQLGSNEPLTFDPDGKNTLYPLIQGFAVLADLCSKTIENGNNLKRPENELPGYFGKTGIELFPFLHEVLILDLRKEDSDRIIALLKEVTTTFERFQVSNIRNRLEHKRRDFPNQDEIERACSAIANIVNKMEVSGICPLIYLYEGRTVDQYRRSVVTFKDYKGREIKINQPSQYILCRLPSFRRSQIIVPGIRIGDSFELIRFELEETSDYVEIWREYPKRKAQVPSEIDPEKKQLEE